MVEELVTSINWVLNKHCHHLQCGNKNADKIAAALPIPMRRQKGLDITRDKQAFHNFYLKFVHHTYSLMLENFKESEDIKYLLVFFFNKRSAEKLLMYMDNQKFFDIREYQRILEEHRSTDVAAKINEMEKN